MAETPNLQELMQKAQEMQSKMKWMQKKLMSKEITGEAGGGLVQVIINGKHEVAKITIDSDTYGKEQKEIVEDLIAAAMNDAVRKMDKLLQDEMRKLATDLGLPEGAGGGSGAGGAV